MENICVYGDSSKNNIVAIMSPVQKNLEDLARSLGKTDMRRELLCMDEDINKALLQELVATGKKGEDRHIQSLESADAVKTISDTAQRFFANL